MERERTHAWTGEGAEAAWEAEHASRRDAEESAARLARLQAVTAALSGACTPDQVAEVALGAGLAAMGAARGVVLVPDSRGDLAVLRAAGAADGERPGAARAELARPAADAFGRAAAAFFEDAAAVRAAYPELEAGEVRGEGLVALPLVFEGRPLGALAFGFDAPRRLGDHERSAATAIADQCAQALERARLFVAERRARAEAEAARARLSFLDAVSEHLAASLDEAEILAGVTQLCVPALGRWAGVFAPEDGALALVAQAGDAALGAAATAHLRGAHEGPLAGASRCAPPSLVVDFRPAPAGEGAPAAASVAALCLGGRSLGALVVVTASPPRGEVRADLSLLGDVGRRTALALEHARLLREATAAAQAREDFLHVASHELRSPLGTLRLTLELLARDVKRGDAGAVEQRLRAVSRQAQRLTRLSDTLLDVSRITAGRLELSREEDDLAALVRDVAARVGAEGSGLPEVVVEAEAPLRCSFDAARMDQVISNLLSNALKYGGGRPVRIAALAAEGRARIEVEDRGIGIAPEHQARIFGRFERAVSGRTYGGLGLGLWIVRRIVEAHGGSISLRSAPGEGAVFRVELPLPAA